MFRKMASVAALAVLLLTTGCSQAASEPTGLARVDSPESPGDQETTMAASSPIGAFFADDGGFEVAISEYNARVDEGIAVCMAAQGFEYVPSSITTSNPLQEAQNELTEREWTIEYGYGISTSFESLAALQATDPNSDIILSLTAAERDLWLETLLGAGFETDTEGTRPLAEQGCIGATIIETGGAETIEGLDKVAVAYDEAEELVFNRSEMIDAVGEWSRCLSEAGLGSFRSLDDPEDRISSDLAVLLEPVEAAFDEIDPGEAQAVFAGDSVDVASIPGLDVDALRELQSRELTVALGDLECYDTHVRSVHTPLRDEFENGLLEEYSTELDSLRTIGN